jgi:hypothetical protein
LEKTEQGPFVPHQLFQVAAPPLAFTKSPSESLIAIGTGNEVRFVHFYAEQGHFELMDQRLGPLPTQVAVLEIAGDLLWVGDRTQSVLCYRFSSEFTISGPPIALDPEPRSLMAMCPVDASTVVVGDRFGVVAFLRLPNDLCKRDLDWKKSKVPDRGIAQPFATVAGSLQTVATFSLGETVTSLIRPPESQVIFYTTLLGKIGAFVPVGDLDLDFELLSVAELMTRRRCAAEFGVTLLDSRPPLNIHVVDADMLDFVEHLDPESQRAIAAAIKMPWQALFGLLSRVKCLAKF